MSHPVAVGAFVVNLIKRVAAGATIKPVNKKVCI